MKTQLLKLACGLALLSAVVTAPAQSVLSITGTGSGTLNGVGFSNDTFDWMITFSTANPTIPWGPTQPIYTILMSQITLQGVGSPINVTQSEGLFVAIDPYYASSGLFFIAPIRMTGSTPGANILGINGTTFLDGLSSFTSSTITTGNFGQFTGVATDQGSLTMNAGTVNLVTVTVEPVPEPTTLALAGLGGLSLLLFRRRE
jgi:hypothetical protein